MSTLWDPEVLGRIRRLALQARQAVDGVLKGSHPSRALGPEVEFVDFKPYAPGDSLRDLDWRILARSDRLVVKRYQAESDLPVTIALDISGDMTTGLSSLGAGGAGRPPLDGTKHGYALALAATIAWYLHLQNEPVGLSLLGGSGAPWRDLPPRTGRRHLGAILGSLASVEPGGRAELGHGLERLASRVRRRSMVILLSDLMEEPSTWIGALGALGRRRTETRVLHLRDSGELALDHGRTAIFFSPEGGGTVALDPVGVRPGFRAVVADWLEEVKRAVTGQRAVYVPVPTDLPLVQPLWRLLAIRPRLWSR